MVIAQGHVYWADLPDPTGSGPGFRRPVLIVQGDALNRSRLRTVVCIPLTSSGLVPQQNCRGDPMWSPVREGRHTGLPLR